MKRLWHLIGLLIMVHAQAFAQSPTINGQSTAGFKLSFAEEFNGPQSPARWNTAIWYETPDPTINYKVENGVLKIWPERNAEGVFRNRTLDTDGKFQQTYGFFEIEAKLPYGKGVWPAFWLFNHIGLRRPEIDVMEAYPGAGPGSGWSNAQLRPTAYGIAVWTDATRLAGSRTVPATDLSSTFNRYGVRWDNAKLAFYFNGNLVYTLNARLRDPMYLLLSLWFGSISGTPDETTPTGESNAYEINYVRAWTLPR